MDKLLKALCGTVALMIALLFPAAVPADDQAAAAAVEEVRDEAQPEPADEPDEVPPTETEQALPEEPEAPLSDAAEPLEMDEEPAGDGKPPLSQFQQMLERPLFSVNRRPRPVTPGDSPAGGGDAAALRETWQLTGVVLIGERRLALMAERKGDKRLSLSIGMPLDEHWHLTEIGPDHVQFSSGEEDARLELREPREVRNPKAEAERRQARPRDRDRGNRQQAGAAEQPRQPAPPTAPPPNAKQDKQ